MNLTHYHPVFALTTERLYPVNLGFSLDEVKLMWVRILFTDNASELAYNYTLECRNIDQPRICSLPLQCGLNASMQ